jgi:hypothetical protein
MRSCVLPPIASSSLSQHHASNASGPSTSAPIAPAPWSRGLRPRTSLHHGLHSRRHNPQVAAITSVVPTARGGGFVPGLGPTPGNVTEHTQDGLFSDQLVFSKFTWPAVLGGQDIYIWGERRAAAQTPHCLPLNAACPLTVMRAECLQVASTIGPKASSSTRLTQKQTPLSSCRSSPARTRWED